MKAATSPASRMRRKAGAAPTIRGAEPDEQKFLENLQRRASLANPGDRDALLAHPDAIALPLDQIIAGRVLVAEEDRVVVGFAVVLPRDDGEAELDGLFVEPERWRSGIGQVLVEQCGGYALAQGATILHVIGNPHASAFYTACGFALVGIRPTRFGPAPALQKRLTA
jgi:GNAT superfamily N-acetyltransferase